MRVEAGEQEKRGGSTATPLPFPRRECPLKSTVRFLVLSVLLLSPVVGYAGGSAALSVTAAVLSKSNCKIDTKAALLNFGTLDPGNPVDVTASVSVDFACRGSAPVASFAFTDDAGLYDTSPADRRMRHVTLSAEYLPYNLDLTPSSGFVPKNVSRTLTITGFVQGADYQDAYAGNYADSVVILLLP